MGKRNGTTRSIGNVAASASRTTNGGGNNSSMPTVTTQGAWVDTVVSTRDKVLDYIASSNAPSLGKKEVIPIANGVKVEISNTAGKGSSDNTIELRITNGSEVVSSVSNYYGKAQVDWAKDTTATDVFKQSGFRNRVRSAFSEALYIFDKTKH